MASQAGPAACGAKVGLGGDGVELVMLQVADVGDEFGERGGEVGRAAVAPAGQGLAQAVDDQTAQAGVVPRQVVQVRRREGLGRASRLRGAVEVARAFDLEAEVDRRQPWVKVGQRLLAASALRQREPVAAVVAFAVGAYQQHVVGVFQCSEQGLFRSVGAGGGGAGGRDPVDADAADALATVDAQVFPGDAHRHGLQ